MEKERISTYFLTLMLSGNSEDRKHTKRKYFSKRARFIFFPIIRIMFESLCKDYPNDADLGAKLRQIINK